MKQRRFHHGFFLILIFSIGFLSTAHSRALTDFGVLDINEGELHFLTKQPEKTPHYHSTHITITSESLVNGWVNNKQCHYNLDEVAAMEIVFRKGRVRNLEIKRAENIGRAWVESNSVQLEDIRKDAVICIVSETLSLEENSLTQTYEWRGGPYMRRFLDGYFPMRVSLAMDYPSELLKLERILPAALKLNAVILPGHIRINTLFEGKLIITTLFSQKKPTPG